MQDSYRFRAMVPGDEKAVRKLLDTLATAEERPDAVTVTEDGLYTLLFGSDSPALGFMCLDKSEHILGYALTARKFSSFKGYPILYIEDVVIASQAQGAGLGRSFMAYLATVALEMGCGRLEWSAETVNQSAIDFYDRLGAQYETGRVHFQADQLLMRRWAMSGQRKSS